MMSKTDSAHVYQNGMESLRVQQYNMTKMVVPPQLPSADSGSSGGPNINAADVLSYSTNSESHSYHSSSTAPSPHFRPQPSALTLSLRGSDGGGGLFEGHDQYVPPIKPALRDTPAIYQNFGLSVSTAQNIQRPVPLAVHNSGVSSSSAPMLPPKHPMPPPYRPPPAGQQQAMRMQGLPMSTTQTGPIAGPPLLGFTRTTSDGGASHDSHNDSGYCPRLGCSCGPSPSLSGIPNQLLNHIRT